jgi:transcriptional regulator with XRE-family HTH domain
MTIHPTQESIAIRIRKIRKDHGWTLADVEKLSMGKFKAIVLGSYERGDRAMSLKRVIELADLYEVPLRFLLEEPQAETTGRKTGLVLDLRHIRANAENDERSRLFATFIEWISLQRNDWNGEIMSLRAGDLAILTLILFSTQEYVVGWLEEKKFLFIGQGQF